MRISIAILSVVIASTSADVFGIEGIPNLLPGIIPSKSTSASESSPASVVLATDVETNRDSKQPFAILDAQVPVANDPFPAPAPQVPVFPPQLPTGPAQEQPLPLSPPTVPSIPTRTSGDQTSIPKDAQQQPKQPHPPPKPPLVVNQSQPQKQQQTSSGESGSEPAKSTSNGKSGAPKAQANITDPSQTLAVIETASVLTINGTASKTVATSAESTSNIRTLGIVGGTVTAVILCSFAYFVYSRLIKKRNKSTVSLETLINEAGPSAATRKSPSQERILASSRLSPSPSSPSSVVSTSSLSRSLKTTISQQQQPQVAYEQYAQQYAQQQQYFAQQQYYAQQRAAQQFSA
ncbi:UNVERIFIED_CONTAM: hypothetical protein HDU68_000660 [Siphonaria sp. JEL0065]|nr:hypothetical protein HDU68_000660 [Siphonaria sp. JEL0065]